MIGQLAIVLMPIVGTARIVKPVGSGTQALQPVEVIEDAIVDGKRNVAGERNGRNPAVRFMIFAPETVAVADTPVRSST